MKPLRNISGTVARVTEQLNGNIRAELSREQLSYSQAAELIGMNRQTFGKSVRGERPWQVDELVALSLVVDMPLMELFRFPADTIRLGFGDVPPGIADSPHTLRGPRLDSRKDI